MGGRIDCYLDVSSFYSYMAITYLLKNRDLLASHNVEIEFHPIFLGGVMVGSDNKPPWTITAKAKYGQFDVLRTKKYHGLEDASPPDFFPPLTLLPQRALCYIKTHFTSSTYEVTFQHFFHALWVLHQNITLPVPLSQTLTSLNLFTSTEVTSIMSATKEKEWKDRLTANTQKVLDLGAFGAPWFWVTNSRGKSEPFFGSDRFHFMYSFLDIPWRDIEILPAAPRPSPEEKAKL
ncbi:thioredoxin-like protein [Stipitochalara longipes BDJ]|nr:thioredoxin-like protein [Stipitochalara longipes BDJ]